MKWGWKHWAIAGLVVGASSVAGATVTVPAVPEPSGFALFAAGAAAVVVALRARRGR
jgi:hypothetical protein